MALIRLFPDSSTGSPISTGSTATKPVSSGLIRLFPGEPEVQPNPNPVVPPKVVATPAPKTLGQKILGGINAAGEKVQHIIEPLYGIKSSPKGALVAPLNTLHPDDLAHIQQTFPDLVNQGPKVNSGKAQPAPAMSPYHAAQQAALNAGHGPMTAKAALKTKEGAAAALNVHNAVEQVVPSTATGIEQPPVMKAVASAAASLKGTYNDAVRRFEDAAAIMGPFPERKATASEKAGKFSSAALGVANVLFSPVGALISGLEEVPVVKYPAKGLEVTGQWLDQKTKAVTNRIIQSLPISQQQKDNLKGPAGEISSLAVQIAIAHGLGKVPGAPEKIAGEINKPIDYMNAVRTRAAIVKANEPIPIQSEPSVTQNVPVKIKIPVTGESAPETGVNVRNLRALKPDEGSPVAIEPLPPERSLEKLTKTTATTENLPVGTELFHNQLGKFTVIRHELIPMEDGTLSKGVVLQDSMGETAPLTLRELQGLRKVNKELNLQSTGEAANTVPDKVVQVAHPDGSTSIFRIPEKDFSTIQEKIDGSAKGIAGERQGNGDVWHITAKSPETLLSREGFKDGGTITPDAVPAKEVAQPVEAPALMKPAETAQSATPAPEQAVVPDNQGKTPIVEGSGETTTPKSEVTPIEGTGAPKTRGLAQGIEEKAIEKKLTDGFSDLPQYKSVDMKEQAQMAADIIRKDYEQAKRIAMGQEAPPHGVVPESVLVAVENRALLEGDTSTIRDLAVNSKLVEEGTTMGQRIRALAERDEESPAGAIKKVIEERQKNARARVKGGDVKAETKKIAKEIDSSMKKTVATKEDWNGFIKSLEC